MGTPRWLIDRAHTRAQNYEKFSNIPFQDQHLASNFLIFAIVYGASPIIFSLFLRVFHVMILNQKKGGITTCCHRAGCFEYQRCPHCSRFLVAAEAEAQVMKAAAIQRPRQHSSCSRLRTEPLPLTSGRPTAQRSVRCGSGVILSADLADSIFFNGAYYFRASDDLNDLELWKSDGTAVGTMRIKDINIGSGPSNPSDFTVFNGVLYFTADDGGTRELWKTNGTPAGTQRVAGVGAVNFQNGMPVLNGALYFMKDLDLWKTDGTAAGTVVVKAINPGVDGFFLDFMVFNGALYFIAYDDTSGWEVWRTDGTDIGTEVVDINAAPGESSYPYGFTIFNDALYFSAHDGVNGRGLWRINATGNAELIAGGVVSIGGLHPSYFAVFNGALYFRASDDVNGRELWKTDGTETALVKDINPGLGDSTPFGFTVFNSALYFNAFDNVNGWELWKTDGTETALVKDINPEVGGSYPFDLTVVNGVLTFSAFDPVNGWELWKTDGTEMGTTLVKVINPDVESLVPDVFFGTGGFVVFDNGILGDMYFLSQ